MPLLFRVQGCQELLPKFLEALVDKYWSQEALRNCFLLRFSFPTNHAIYPEQSFREGCDAYRLRTIQLQ